MAADPLDDTVPDDTVPDDTVPDDTVPDETVLLCPINISEGRDLAVVDRVAGAAGDAVRDLHVDADHHRSVVTLGGPAAVVLEAACSLTAAAVAAIDLTHHRGGVHPRFGAVDVVPFVPVGSTDPSVALAARDRYCDRVGLELDLPCFTYGDLDAGHTLPELRAGAFRDVWPVTGPLTPHPTAGAVAVGARRPLVAYNLWVAPATGRRAPDHPSATLAAARAVAAAVRSPRIRSLGLPFRHGAQVSCNLIDPGPDSLVELYDRVAAALAGRSYRIERAELVGLAPLAVVEGVPEDRRAELDVHPDRSVEIRLGVRPR